VVLDLCCGSGAVGLAVAAERRDVELHAADVDPVAVACARRNIAAVGGRVHEGDLFGALPSCLRGRVDVLAANVPYVPSGEIARMPPEARDHEPRAALDGGPDGLVVARRVVSGAPEWLAPGGSLLFETSEDQAPIATALVRAGGLVPRVAGDDELGATVVVGTLALGR
jgi:release factor glutamine methyltransferase